MATIETLFFGFPARSSRGFLGWSAVYLVVTQGGRKILFDTAGYNERATLVAALEQRKIRLDGIHTVVLSHLHFDHAANWDLFPGAEIVVHEKEMEYACSPQADYSTLRHQSRALAESRRLSLISKDGELEPDVQLMLVPGHTPGSMALKMGSSVLCGDALKNRWDLQGQVSLPVWDAEKFQASVRKLASLADKLYPGHDVPLELEAHGWVPRGKPSINLTFANNQEQELVIEP
jgi:glyoxylase-like metal-dependent hydrolase (beta-lactamase superfamily II)